MIDIIKYIINKR